MSVSPVATEPVPWWRRIGLAFALFFRVLFDGRLAARLSAGLVPAPAPERVDPPSPVSSPPPPPQEAPAPASPASASSDALPTDALPTDALPTDALQKSREEGATLLLSLLQAEGRLVDFVQQPLSGFDDAEIGAVARVVHDGCRRVVESHLSLEAVLGQPEGEAVVLAEGYDAGTIKLTGDLSGRGALKGVLRHKGWRATDVRLPVLAESHRSEVICPAEVEV